MLTKQQVLANVQHYVPSWVIYSHVTYWRSDWLSLSLSHSLSEHRRRLIFSLFVVAGIHPAFALGVAPADLTGTRSAATIPEVREAQVAFSPRGEALSHILRELRGARQSVDVAMFYLSDKNLVDALCFLAQRRDITVRLLTDGGMSTSAQVPVLKKLAQHGVSVFILRLPGRARMHLKCAVVDGETVIAGAANWTSTAFGQNFEDTLIIKSKALGKRYTDHLDGLMTKAEPFQENIYEQPPRASFPEIERYEPSKRRDRYQPPRSKMVRDIRQTELFFTPGPDGLDRLVAHIRHADRRIDIGMYLLNEAEITEALIETAQRGVQIGMVIDSGMLGGLLPQLQALSDAGVEIYYYQQDRASMHLKAAVIDERYVWTGSANWTTGAMMLNVEDMLMFDSVDMARAYVQFIDGIREFSQSFAPLSWGHEVAKVELQVDRDSSGYLVGLPPTIPRTQFQNLNLSKDPSFPAFEVRASVAYLPDDQYLPVLIDLLQNAHQSILITMFVMPTTATEARHQERVVRELERAAARGVYVYMLLHLPPGMEGLHVAHSNWAKTLRERGVDVRLNLPGVHLHDKMVVVDLAKVIIGSHNWSDGALSGSRVYEASVLLVLAEQDSRFADYVFSRQVISDMRSQELWEQEVSLLRHLRSMRRGDQKAYIRQLEGARQP